MNWSHAAIDDSTTTKHVRYEFLKFKCFMNPHMERMENTYVISQLKLLDTNVFL